MLKTCAVTERYSNENEIYVISKRSKQDPTSLCEYAYFNCLLLNSSKYDFEDVRICSIISKTREEMSCN